MVVEKSTIIDRIEILRDGTVQNRIGLLRLSEDKEIGCAWHRTVVGPNTNVRAQMDEVNRHLFAMSELPVTDDDVRHLEAIVGVART